jgi:hypothetical protein
MELSSMPSRSVLVGRVLAFLFTISFIAAKEDAGVVEVGDTFLEKEGLDFISFLQIQHVVKPRKETKQLGEKKSTDPAGVSLSTPQDTPQATPQGLVEKKRSVSQLAHDVQNIRRKRDRYWKQWHSMTTACRLLREQNRDFEEEVLTYGHMILLSLEMKMAVEKKKTLNQNQSLPQNEYKSLISSQQIAQKKRYKEMLRNRQTADRVCFKEKKLRTMYKAYIGRYQRANLHLRWRMARGCFHHGTAHYCVSVKKWCGKGSNTHPCVAKAALMSGATEDSAVADKESKVIKAKKLSQRERESLFHSSMNLLQMSAPAEAVSAASLALQHTTWPTEKSCFSHQQKQHCSFVKKWIRHPGLTPNHAGILPGHAFLPQSIEVHTYPSTKRPT